MKVFVLLAVLAFCGFSIAHEHTEHTADEDKGKKAKTLAIWNCLSCHEDQAARDEFMKCADMKPERCKEEVKVCKAKIIPDAVTDEAVFKTVCKNENNVAETLYDCVRYEEHKDHLTDEEKEQWEKFFTCAKNVSKKFCKNM